MKFGRSKQTCEKKRKIKAREEESVINYKRCEKSNKRQEERKKPSICKRRKRGYENKTKTNMELLGS
jgi:hypothetical protein